MPKITIFYAPPGTTCPQITNICDYLYEVTYDKLDYDKAYRYYSSLGDSTPPACSSVRNGNWYGRNFDWLYSNQAEFIVHTTGTSDRKASVGVAGGLKSLTDARVKQRIPSIDYDILPFQMYDGINECGVVANINVVPTDYGTNKSIPLVSQEHEICASMIVRFILDRFETAKEAVEYIRDYVSVYFSKGTHKMGYEIHCMVGDNDNTYILEFIDNRAVISDVSDFAAMTNFYHHGVQFNSDHTVYTPETQTSTKDAVKTNLITDNGSGLERYNLIVDEYANADSHIGMRNLMQLLSYTRAYSTSNNPANPVWNTEFVGYRGLKCNSPEDDFDYIQGYAGELFSKRTRGDGMTWQTVHSSVYDIENKTLYVEVQENHEKEYTFEIAQN